MTPAPPRPAAQLPSASAAPSPALSTERDRRPSPSCVFYSRFLTKTGRNNAFLWIHCPPPSPTWKRYPPNKSVSVSPWHSWWSQLEARGRRTAALPYLLPPWVSRGTETGCFGKEGSLWGAIPGPGPKREAEAHPPLVSGSLVPFGCVCVCVCMCVCVF